MAAQELGWAPVGQRLLREWSEQHEPAGAGAAPASRFVKSWGEIKGLAALQALPGLMVAHMALLHAVDTVPRGGVCQGAALKESLRRYERLWLPLLVAQQRAGAHEQLVPPLDVALMWHLHRLQLEQYEADCAEAKAADGSRATATPHPSAQQAFAFSDGSDAAGAATAALWRRAYPQEPFWPPPAPGGAAAAARSRLSADLAAVAVRVPVFTHQLLRACYAQGAFLDQSVDRYARFLLLRKHHLELQHPLPPLDVTLAWATHMSLSGAYAADCAQLLGRPFLDMPGAGASPWLERDATGPWRFHWADTRRAWGEEFEDPFVVPGSGYVPLSSAHPAEALVPQQLLACFEQGAPADGKGGGAAAWRAGAHALYLCWLRDPGLLQELHRQVAEEEAAAHPPAPAPARPADPAPAPAPPPPPPPPPPQPRRKKGGGGLFACFGCGGAADADSDGGAPPSAAPAVVQQQQQQAAAAAAAAEARSAPLPLMPDADLRKLAAGFVAFRHLPHSSSHIYWRQLRPRAAADAALAGAATQQGAEVEVLAQPAAAAAANGRHGGGGASGSGRARDAGGALDQSSGGGAAAGGSYEGDYGVQVGSSPALMW